MNFKDKNVLILGMARSGIAAAEKLNSLGAKVLVVDCADNRSLRLKATELQQQGISTHIGSQPPSYAEDKELIVISPGVPSDISLFKRARELEVPIWSEVELAYRLAGPSPFIVGITGTNGKTTTATLIGEMYKKSFPTVVGGNIGNPLVSNLENVSSDTKFVVELSSFQLENIVKFRPRISILLNITDDHLDRYADIDDYAEAKGRIFLNQTKEDYAILNYDDPITRNFASSIKGKVIPFSKSNEFDTGIFIKSGKIFFNSKGISKEICGVDKLKIKGEHNLDNAMAAVAASLIGGVPLDFARETLFNFKGLKHRVEYVATIDGIEFYNDSKATNPDAVIKALTAFDKPIILLAGGRNKKNSFQSVAEASKDKVKAAIVFGEAANEIKSSFINLNIPVKGSPSLADAVMMAFETSKVGDVVLLSPACASFDMFSNYKERGEAFKKVVLKIKEDAYGSKKN